jgi:hypothetical protein
MTSFRAILLLALVGLGGCGGRSFSSSSPPFGRSLGAEPTLASEAPAPSGDPPQERNGKVPQDGAAAEGKLAPTVIAPSPEAALGRYAQIYTNWQASSLPAHERELASLAIGAARLAAEQIAASESGAAGLAANHVQNKGIVLVIALGRGPARGQWVVITREQTTGTGPYAGLPSSPHVTLARVTRVGHGWAVSGWTPES